MIVADAAGTTNQKTLFGSSLIRSPLMLTCHAKVGAQLPLKAALPVVYFPAWVKRAKPFQPGLAVAGCLTVAAVRRIFRAGIRRTRYPNATSLFTCHIVLGEPWKMGRWSMIYLPFSCVFPILERNFRFSVIWLFDGCPIVQNKKDKLETWKLQYEINSI